MITATRETLYEPLMTTVGAQQIHTFPFKVTVTASSGEAMSPKIFVYHANSMVKGEASDADLFEAVASVHQLMELPPDKPAYDPALPDKYYPYYRTSVLLFHCRSEEEAEELWLKVQEDIGDLTRSFAAATALRVVEAVDFSTT